MILTAWLTIGRTGESAFISFDKMWWDALFNCVFVEIYQFKPGKMKIVPFIVGTTRHLCWYPAMHPSHSQSHTARGQHHTQDECHSSRFFAMALYLMHPESHSQPPRDDDDDDDDSADRPGWLFPSLNALKDPCGAVNRFVQNLLPGKRMHDYYPKEGSPVWVPLSPNVTAQGFRVGCINTCCQFMPDFLVATLSGHHGNWSTLYEYLRANLPMCMPAARALTNWRTPTPGFLCPGPVPPSLEPLYNCTVVDRETFTTKLDVFIDHLFWLNDNAHVKLRLGGGLRMMVRTCLAAMLMYYTDLVKENTLYEPRQMLRKALIYAGLATQSTAELVLEGFSRAIKTKFELDNLEHVPETTAHVQARISPFM